LPNPGAAAGPELFRFFKFSPDIRKAVYTTNAIEPVNYTIQKIIKHRQSFPNDQAAMKLIFMGLKNISGKWTMPIRDWGTVLNQCTINHFWGRQGSPYDLPFTQKKLQIQKSTFLEDSFEN
jgi:hypothetical protein